MLTPLGNRLPAMARPGRRTPALLRFERNETPEGTPRSSWATGYTRAIAAPSHQAKSPFPRHEGQRCSPDARRAPECSPPWQRDAPHELSALPDAQQELTGAASFALPENFAPPPHELSALPDAQQELTGAASFALPENFAPPPPEPFHEQTPSQPTGPRRHEPEHGNFRECTLDQHQPVRPLQSREKQPLRPRERKSQRGRLLRALPAEQQPEAAPAGACWRQTAAAAREGAAPPDVFPPHGSAWRDSADRFPHLRPDCELPD